MRTKITAAGGFFIVLILIMSGCDAAVNPIILDGTPIHAQIGINTSGHHYDETALINLNGILEGVEDAVDSVSVYNITLRVKDLVSPAATASFNGSVYINAAQFIVISDLTLGDFAIERSIFDSGLAEKIDINDSGLAYLKSLFAAVPGAPFVNVRAVGHVGETPLRFTIEVGLYTQVYTSP